MHSSSVLTAPHILSNRSSTFSGSLSTRIRVLLLGQFGPSGMSTVPDDCPFWRSLTFLVVSSSCGPKRPLLRLLQYLSKARRRPLSGSAREVEVSAVNVFFPRFSPMRLCLTANLVLVPEEPTTLAARRARFLTLAARKRPMASLHVNFGIRVF